jgi:hypothetical protein
VKNIPDAAAHRVPINRPQPPDELSHLFGDLRRDPLAIRCDPIGELINHRTEDRRQLGAEHVRESSDGSLQLNP